MRNFFLSTMASTLVVVSPLIGGSETSGYQMDRLHVEFRSVPIPAMHSTITSNFGNRTIDSLLLSKAVDSLV